MPKNIILCFDGTKENFGPQPYTNVLKIYRLLDTTNQICYYQPGIGTAATFDSMDDLQRYFTFSGVKNTLDAMFAFCLDDHITSAYLYLMHHYKPGDKIYMFGFSRGAFIGRVLAGMIERVGLLNEGLDDMVGMAWKIYESWEYAEQPSSSSYTTTLIQEFKMIFSRDYNINIHFQGFFDSVNSVGFFRERLFPCTQRSNIVKHVRHALSIDERRGKFKQVCFTPNPYRPEIFSLRNKTIVRKDSDLLYSVYSTTATATTTPSSANLRGSLVNRTNIIFSVHNPIIDITLHKFVGLSQSTSSYLDTYYTGESTLQEKSDSFIKRVDSFLGNINPQANSYTFINRDNIEGRFKVSKNVSYSESLDGTVISTFSDQTLTPDLQEKWFPGDHCDIGGGWVSDCKSHNFLSNVALRWMLAESIKNGVKFKPGVISRFATKYTSLGSICCSTHDYLKVKPCKYCNNGKGHHLALSQSMLDNNLQINTNFVQLYPEEEDNVSIESNESIKSVHDLITTNCTHIRNLLNVFWWLVELLPIGLKLESEDGKWRNIYIPNLGRSRCIPVYADMHWSVYWRLKFRNDYRPNNLPSYVYDILNKDILRVGNAAKLQFQLGEETVEDSQEVQIKDKDIEQFKMMSNLIYRQAIRDISNWEKDNWLTIPDDLELLLDNDPDL